jgi:hypothetical protein
MAGRAGGEGRADLAGGAAGNSKLLGNTEPADAYINSRGRSSYGVMNCCSDTHLHKQDFRMTWVYKLHAKDTQDSST